MMLLAGNFAVTGLKSITNYRIFANGCFMHSTKLKLMRLCLSRLISYFEPLRILNSVFGAILMEMNHIFIVGQSRAIIGRRGSYQGLSPDSHHL